MILFEWNEKKNRANRKKHGIWFEEAQQVFDDVAALRFYDTHHSNDEDRFILLGMSGSSRILVVVFCEKERKDTIRIISARKATKREAKKYEEGI
jgi:uncharacterized DUF497 family protein